MITVQTQGFIELKTKLSKPLQPKIKAVVQRLVLFMERQARRNITESVYNRAVPWRRTGKARQSIIGKMIGSTSGRVYMGVNYGSFIEFGTRPRTITTPKRSLSNGQVFFGKTVNHPGTKAYPFWRPAIKSTEQEAKKELKKLSI
jgi:hypothetical protein